ETLCRELRSERERSVVAEVLDVRPAADDRDASILEEQGRVVEARLGHRDGREGSGRDVVDERVARLRVAVEKTRPHDQDRLGIDAGRRVTVAADRRLARRLPRRLSRLGERADELWVVDFATASAGAGLARRFGLDGVGCPTLPRLARRLDRDLALT